jgi:hypothetical protein
LRRLSHRTTSRQRRPEPVSDIKVPIGFDDPMYMIVNLAMGSKYFEGAGFVDAESPVTIEFEIDRISAYQFDSY